MKIEKSKLLKALETVKPGLAVKEMVEQSTSFCFVGGKVVTYNDEISINCPVDGLELTGAVNSTELYAFVNKATKEEINIEIIDNEIILKSGRAKAGLTLQADIVLPIDEIGEIKDWKKLPDNFKEGLRFVMGTCSRDMSMPVLTCVHVNRKTLEGSDNYRISNYMLSGKVPTRPFLLPADTCAKIIRMDIVSIAEGSGWIHFKTSEGAVISCRTFQDKYVDLSTRLNVDGTKITFPKEIKDILDRAGIFSKRDHSLDETITIRIESGKLFIKSESDSGWYEEKSRIKYAGDSIEFMITPYLLQDILKQTNDAYVGSGSLGFIGENWKYMSLLKN